MPYDDTVATPRQRVVLLYGDSVFLSGVAETLRTNPALNVLEVKPQTDPPLLDSQNPDVVLMDAAQITPNQVEVLMASFSANPTPAFLRLNADIQELTVLSAQHYPAVNLSDLTQMLEKLFLLGEA